MTDLPLLGGVKLPQINPKKLGRGYLLRTARRGAEKWVWPVLEAVGEERFRWLIDNNKPFLDRVPEDKVPQKWGEWILIARSYQWALSLIGDRDWITLLPEWLAKLVTRDNKSWQWFMNEIRWLKSQVLEGGKS